MKAMASSSSSKQHSDAEWRKHKFSIERMFCGENKSLAEIKHHLEHDGFMVSKSQLEYRLKLWGFRKRVQKNLGSAVYQFIDHRLQARQQKGKATEVVINGRVVDAAKVRKQIMQHPETTIAKFTQPSPRTPEGLDISLETPAPLNMRFSWPVDLPWHRFEESFLHFFSADTNKVADDLVYGKEDIASTDKLLRSLIPHYTNRSEVTQLAAEIGSILPENYENENIRRASRLLQGSPDERYAEYVKITLYKFSNNLHNLSDAYNYGQFDKWNEITDLLENSGLMASPLELQRITDSTTNAIIERLFQSAIEFLDTGTSLEKCLEGRIIIFGVDLTTARLRSLPRPFIPNR
ncbi:hypothetical protein LZ32DRAFT_688380 [Colletotrichum eremochloae]|nr:hypothetical protein LZ32DRAFT_688380 [Colletotrichum eremochloae]